METATERAEVEAVVRRYLHAVAARDWDGSAACLTERVQRDLVAFVQRDLAHPEIRDCPRALARVMACSNPAKIAASLASIEVISIRVAGERAQVELRGARGLVHLRSTEEGWRISRLAG